MADKETKKKDETPVEETPETQAETEVETPEEVKAPEANPWEEKYNAEHDARLRLAAEYDNFRKRTTKEKEQSYGNGKADAVTKMLPIYDNLERALNQPTEDAAYKKGVEMTMTELVKILNGLGVEIFGEPGDVFDPNIHNAVMHLDSDEHEENTITQVFQKGFKLGGTGDPSPTVWSVFAAVPGDAFRLPAKARQEVPLLNGGSEHVVIGLLIGVEQAVNRLSILFCGAAHGTVHRPAQGRQTVDFLQRHGVEVEIAIGVVQPVDGGAILGGIPCGAIQCPSGCQQGFLLRFIGHQQMLVCVLVIQTVDGDGVGFVTISGRCLHLCRRIGLPGDVSAVVQHHVLGPGGVVPGIVGGGSYIPKCVGFNLGGISLEYDGYQLFTVAESIFVNL